MTNTKEDRALIRRSGLFNAGWYKKQYPDVEILGLDPLDHYLQIGALLQRDPGPDFDTREYLKHNPDARKADVSPLVYHIRKYGTLAPKQKTSSKADASAAGAPRAIAEPGSWSFVLATAAPISAGIRERLDELLNAGMQVVLCTAETAHTEETEAWLTAAEGVDLVTIRGATASWRDGVFAGTRASVLVLDADLSTDQDAGAALDLIAVIDGVDADVMQLTLAKQTRLLALKTELLTGLEQLPKTLQELGQQLNKIAVSKTAPEKSESNV